MQFDSLLTMRQRTKFPAVADYLDVKAVINTDPTAAASFLTGGHYP